MENNNTVAITESTNFAMQINESDSNIYMSFKAEDIEDKKLLYMATNGGTLLKDVFNKPIKMMDVVITDGTVVNKETGEVNIVPRVSIITTEGEVYVASSFGVYNCLKRIKAIFGTLHFEDGLEIVAKSVATKGGSTTTINVL